jgi:hypothetical protein
MLKVYNIINYVSIDGAPWRVINYRDVASDTELETQLVLDNLSFDEVRDYLSQNSLGGVWNDSTLFGKKPTIEVNYYSACEPVTYKKFHTLSYKKVVKEWTNVSLDWIMKHLSADRCIQYLKERGMTACPILK